MDSASDLALLRAVLRDLGGEPACVVQLRDRTVLALYFDQQRLVSIDPEGAIEVLALERSYPLRDSAAAEDQSDDRQGGPPH